MWVTLCKGFWEIFMWRTAVDNPSLCRPFTQDPFQLQSYRNTFLKHSQLNCPQEGHDRRVCRTWSTVPTSLPPFPTANTALQPPGLSKSIQVSGPVGLAVFPLLPFLSMSSFINSDLSLKAPSSDRPSLIPLFTRSSISLTCFLGFLPLPNALLYIYSFMVYCRNLWFFFL